MTRIGAWLKVASHGCLLALVSLSALAADDARLLHERTPGQQPALLVLGTGHLDNPGRDLFKAASTRAIGIIERGGGNSAGTRGIRSVCAWRRN